MTIALDDPLTTLAIRHGTDKFGFHRYTPVYHRLLARYRDRPVRLLEIGVGGYDAPDQGGQSLAAWRDYFPQGTITGIDIARKSMDLGPRVRILQGSQVDHAFLADLVRDHGPFDIIIDDGSHQNAHVIDTFEVLFPGLAPGGLYVVEDVQTAFIARFGGSRGLDAPNSVAFFRDLLPTLPRPADDAAFPGLAGIERFHNMIALHKAGPSGPPAIPGHPLWDMLPASARAADVVALPGGTATPDEVRQALVGLRDPGLVILEGRPGAALAAWLQDRFVEVDHAEITVQFPDAHIDPLAPVIHALIALPDGVMLLRAPNDFPSNFGFHAGNPAAAAVLDHIGATLDAMPDATENGLVAHAAMLTLLRGPSHAARWLDRLDAMGASSRQYLRLVVDRAERQGDMARLVETCATLLRQYPDAQDIAAKLANLHLEAGRDEDARMVVAAGLAARPQDAGLHLLMVRVAERLRLADLAVTHAQAAARHAPAKSQVNAQIALGRALRRAGQPTEAAAVLTALTAAAGAGSARAWRELSAAHAALKAQEAARAAVARAIALAPDNAEYVRWQARLAEKD